MGNLFRRGDTWYADYYDRDGKRQKRTTRTSDVKVARARLRELELATTDRAAHETETVAVAVTTFVDVTCAGRAGGTVRCYRQKARWLAQHLGERLLDKLSRGDVERYIATRLGEGAHPHSVHKELVVLRGALKAAAKRDRFHGTLDVVPPFDSGYVPRTSYLTEAQFTALVPHLVPPAPAREKESTLERRLERARRRALYCLLIAFASPRRGELEALRWDHVDLARGVMRIPKGKTIGRPIAIHPVLAPWLEAMHAGVGLVLERWSNIGRDLPRACERAGVPRTTPNDLRRTFASWLIQAGVSHRIVAKLLGHKSTRMVELVYGQIDDATLEASISRIGGWDAGGTHAAPRGGIPGNGGTGARPTLVTNSVEESFASSTNVVPRAGIEPATRGFSALASMAPSRALFASKSLPKLRSVK